MRAKNKNRATYRRPQKCGHRFMHRRPLLEPMEYRNRQLMDDLNEFMVAVKVWLLDEAANLRGRYAKPTVDGMDELLFRILEELRKDARPMRRY